MSTQFRPLEIPPGVVSKPTKQQRSSNWVEVNLMRWVEGELAPIGGQAAYSNIVGGVETYVFASRCKAIHGWYGLDQTHYVAYLCEANLYVDIGGTLYDLTPRAGLTTSVYGSGSYGVGGYSGDPTYGMTPPALYGVGGYGDAGYGAGTYGTPRPEDTIAALDQIPDAFSLDNFGQILLAMTSSDGRLLQWDPAAGPPTPHGSGIVLAATASFTKTSPTIAMVANPGTIVPGMSVFDQTNGQQIGVVQSYGGTTLTLSANAMSASAGAADALEFASIASQVAGAPLGRLFVVTNERFVQIFATAQDGTADGGSFRRFAWCDQGNPYAWDFSNVTSQAGFLDIEPAAPIIAAMTTKTGVLFWTGTTTYISRFLGIPYVYNYTELAENTTPWSPQSKVTTSTLALWMSKQGLFSFDGTSVLPVACLVKSWIDDDIDLLNVREQACAVHVADFNEFWWFFPQDSQAHNTRVVIYSFKEGWWSQGQMSRSAGITSAYTVHTIMADGFIAYEHEAGNTYPTNVPLPWAETFDLNLNSGSRLTTVKQMIPDVDGDVENLLYSLFYRMSRSVQNGSPVIELQTPLQPVRPDGYVDFRTTARDIRLRIQLKGPMVLPVTVGQHLVDSVPRGDR